MDTAQQQYGGCEVDMPLSRSSDVPTNTWYLTIKYSSASLFDVHIIQERFHTRPNFGIILQGKLSPLDADPVPYPFRHQ